MDIKEFKKKVEERTVPSDIFFFIVSDVSFVPLQYIREISSYKNKDIVQTDVISYVNDIFGSSDDCINICSVDTFELNDPNILRVKDTFVICNKLKNNTKEDVSYNTVNVPKLEKWQIQDYAYSILGGVDRKLVDDLLEASKYDIFRVDNELSKISIFDEKTRGFIFNRLLEDNGFSDLSKYKIFDFSNAVVTKNYEVISSIYKEINSIDIEPIGLLTILTNQFRNIMSVQLSNNPTPESVGLKPNQFWAIKHLCGIYTKEQLVSIYKFLTDIDRRIKVGDMPMNILIDYLVVKVLSL